MDKTGKSATSITASTNFTRTSASSSRSDSWWAFTTRCWSSTELSWLATQSSVSPSLDPIARNISPNLETIKLRSLRTTCATRLCWSIWQKPSADWLSRTRRCRIWQATPLWSMRWTRCSQIWARASTSESWSPQKSQVELKTRVLLRKILSNQLKVPKSYMLMTSSSKTSQFIARTATNWSARWTLRSNLACTCSFRDPMAVESLLCSESLANSGRPSQVSLPSPLLTRFSTSPRDLTFLAVLSVIKWSTPTRWLTWRRKDIQTM